MQLRPGSPAYEQRPYPRLPLSWVPRRGSATIQIRWEADLKVHGQSSHDVVFEAMGMNDKLVFEFRILK